MMRNGHQRAWLYALLAFSLATTLPAQTVQEPQAPTATRPRIGLVLSGGGARGGAHIGALRALEELRIPIDVIAGTSIGAVVGGLYASGVTVDELEAAVREIDWDTAFLDDGPRRLRTFRRKRDDDLFLVDQRPGFRDGEIQLPAGLVQGQIVDLILSRLTLPVAAIVEFDDLMIPFRAVATDIATGEAIVLGQGGLARAMRASLSVPAVIAPVEIDGRRLVDGGISMNLPIEVALDMGADIIIAVDITTPLRQRDQLDSVVDITSQLTNFLTRHTLDAQLELLDDDDHLFAPTFDDTVSPTTFSRMGETIVAGYETLMARRDALADLGLDPAAYLAYRRERESPRSPDLPVIDFVRIINRTGVADRILEPQIQDIVIGETLDVEAVEVSVSRLYGLELAQNVRYEVVRDGDETGLEIDIEPRAWGPNYFQFGMQYSYSGQENAVFGLAASYLRTELNELGGEWRSTVVVGDHPALFTGLFQPFGLHGLAFFAPSLTFESRLLSVFDNSEILAEVRLRQMLLELAVGRALGSWGEWRAGLRAARGSTELRVGDSAVYGIDDYRNGEAFLRLAADTLDSVAFPRSGMFGRAELRWSRPDWLGADQKFEQLELETAYARTWGRHTLLSTLRYDTTLDGDVSFINQFRLGGFLDLSGLNRSQLLAPHVLRIGSNYYRRIGDLALFPAFAGISLEIGNAWDDRADISLDGAIVGGSLWTGVDTPVGPVYLGYGVAEGGLSSFYVFLGRAF